MLARSKRARGPHYKALLQVLLHSASDGEAGYIAVDRKLKVQDTTCLGHVVTPCLPETQPRLGICRLHRELVAEDVGQLRTVPGHKSAKAQKSDQTVSKCFFLAVSHIQSILSEYGALGDGSR